MNMQPIGPSFCEAKTWELYHKGHELLHSPAFEKIRQTPAARTEICVGSNLLRGCYFPSPVYDLLVGNNPRGHLLKRPTTKRLDYIQLEYDDAGTMLRSTKIYQGRVVYTECLIPEDGKRYGVAFISDERFLSTDGELYSVCEESFEGNVLTEMSYGSYNEMDHSMYGNPCIKMHHEKYTYSDAGIISCIYQKMDVASWLQYPHLGFTEQHYQFDREGEYIVAANLLWKHSKGTNLGQTHFEFTKKRKA